MFPFILVLIKLSKTMRFAVICLYSTHLQNIWCIYWELFYFLKSKRHLSPCRIYSNFLFQDVKVSLLADICEDILPPGAGVRPDKPEFVPGSFGGGRCVGNKIDINLLNAVPSLSNTHLGPNWYELLIMITTSYSVISAKTQQGSPQRGKVGFQFKFKVSNSLVVHWYS